MINFLTGDRRLRRMRDRADEAARAAYDPSIFEPQRQQAAQQATQGLPTERVRQGALASIFRSAQPGQLALFGGDQSRAIGGMTAMDAGRATAMADAEAQIGLADEQARLEGQGQLAEILGQQREIAGRRDAAIASNQAMLEAERSRRRGALATGAMNLGLAAFGPAIGAGIAGLFAGDEAEAAVGEVVGDTLPFADMSSVSFAPQSQDNMFGLTTADIFRPTTDAPAATQPISDATQPIADAVSPIDTGIMSLEDSFAQAPEEPSYDFEPFEPELRLGELSETEDEQTQFDPFVETGQQLDAFTPAAGDASAVRGVFDQQPSEAGLMSQLGMLTGAIQRNMPGAIRYMRRGGLSDFMEYVSREAEALSGARQRFMEGWRGDTQPQSPTFDANFESAAPSLPFEEQDAQPEMTLEQSVIRGLLDRGLEPHIAAGIAGNVAVESMFDPSINEINPMVEGSRGGFGLMQWTGPRRVALEAAAAEAGVDPSDLNFQLDYAMQELQTTERGAWLRLQRAETAEEAAQIFSDYFLRPGIPHLQRRIREASRLQTQIPNVSL